MAFHSVIHSLLPLSVISSRVFLTIYIVNSSSEFSFDFTSLKIFDGLDPSFFNPILFDSPEAIATGSLVLDLLAEASNLEIEKNASIGLAIGPLDLSGYVLLLGTARPILSDDTFGAEMNFSFAETISTPEPQTLLLIIPGITVLLIGPFFKKRV